LEQRLRSLGYMTESPWLPIAIVWLVVVAVSGVLWQRFTRVPVQSSGLSRVPPTTRRVVPLWLAVVLVLLLVMAVWLTARLVR
jgi:hypothetical protein